MWIILSRKAKTGALRIYVASTRFQRVRVGIGVHLRIPTVGKLQGYKYLKEWAEVSEGGVENSQKHEIILVDCSLFHFCSSSVRQRKHIVGHGMAASNYLTDKILLTNCQHQVHLLLNGSLHGYVSLLLWSSFWWRGQNLIKLLLLRTRQWGYLGMPLSRVPTTLLVALWGRGGWLLPPEFYSLSTFHAMGHRYLHMAIIW